MYNSRFYERECFLRLLFEFLDIAIAELLGQRRINALWRTEEVSLLIINAILKVVFHRKDQLSKDKQNTYAKGYS